MRRTIRTIAAAALASGGLLLAVPASASQPETNVPGHGAAPSVVPIRGVDGGGVPVSGQARPTSGGGGNGISYHGGAVMTQGVNAYIIWYGNWAGNTATTILPTLLNGLSGSTHFGINTTYTDGTGAKVANKVTVAGQVSDAYSQGAVNLSDAQIQSIVSAKISSGALPKDPNGLYFVFTSKDVTKSGFLTSYCGWHTHASISGTDLKYSFVGDPGTSAACAAQTASSPNANVGADAMASVVTHELEETATDPGLNAWYDSTGKENADKCAWTFGTQLTATNGSKYNLTVGGLQFLIQRNWVNASGGYCSL